MLINEIKNEAKSKKVIIFFDMDGTVAEFDFVDKSRLLNNEKNFYLNQRPLNSIIEVAKELGEIENVTVGILSNCYFEEQKQDKIAWLEKYMPFINKDNIHIIKLSEEKYDKDDKYFIKAKYLEKLSKGFDVVYQIEDDHRVIKATRKALPEVKAVHISMLIK